MKGEHGEEKKWDNSTKKAAEIMHSYLLKNQNEMSSKEAHAMRVLIAAAAQNPDSSPKTWYCDTYCRKVRHAACEGRLSAEDCAEERCPYLDEMLY